MSAYAQRGLQGLGLDRRGYSVEEGLKHVVDAARDVLSTFETERLLDVLMDRVVALTRADRGFLMLRDAEGKLRFRNGRGIDQADLDADAARISRSVADEVYRTGEPILSINAPDDETLRNRKSVLELRLQTVMCAPLLAGGRTIGVLYVDSNRVRSLFDNTGFAVFQALVNLAAIALENARLYTLATTDARTGIANAGLFHARLDQALGEARRAGGELGLVLADLDHFKRVNDTWGHPAGDIVIRGAAERMRAAVRPEDLVARVGGEEFAVILSPAGDRPCDPLALAERMRRLLADEPFLLADGTSITVTASFGIARFPAPDIDTPAQLFDAADRALYQAKHAGRNRVVDQAPALTG